MEEYFKCSLHHAPLNRTQFYMKSLDNLYAWYQRFYIIKLFLNIDESIRLFVKMREMILDSRFAS